MVPPLAQPVRIRPARPSSASAPRATHGDPDARTLVGRDRSGGCREACMRTESDTLGESAGRTAFLFDLDGTLVDSVYQHVLAWQEAMTSMGIELAVWTIHRRIGMSGGLMVNALLRETGHPIA